MMQWEVKPYRPRLALDYLGQPQFGVSVGGYAGQGGLYGAVSGIFSDLLGHHTMLERHGQGRAGIPSGTATDGIHKDQHGALLVANRGINLGGAC